MKQAASGSIMEAQMRKQDRIQQQKNQDPSRQQGQQSPQSNEQVKGTDSGAQPSRPPREPGKPLPIPD